MSNLNAASGTLQTAVEGIEKVLDQMVTDMTKGQPEWIVQSLLAGMKATLTKAANKAIANVMEAKKAALAEERMNVRIALTNFILTEGTLQSHDQVQQLLAKYAPSGQREAAALNSRMDEDEIISIMMCIEDDNHDAVVCSLNIIKRKLDQLRSVRGRMVKEMVGDLAGFAQVLSFYPDDAAARQVIKEYQASMGVLPANKVCDLHSRMVDSLNRLSFD